MAINKSQKIANYFICNYCYYKTYNIYDYNKHLNTIKHKTSEKSIESIALAIIKSPHIFFECKICNKKYKDNSGLWRHKKKCFSENIILKKEEINEENEEISNNLIIEILKSNNEIVKSNSELHKKISSLKDFIIEKSQELKYPINNQLINLIVDKINTISELKNIINEKEIISDVIPLSKELFTLTMVFNAKGFLGKRVRKHCPSQTDQ